MAVALVTLPCTVGSDPGHHPGPSGPVALASYKRAEPTLPRKLPLVPIEFTAFDATQQGAYDQIILAAARDWDLDPFILKGLLRVESGFDPKITNKDTGAAGIAQFMPSGRAAVTRIRRLRDRKAPGFSHKDALDPEKAIPAAAELLAFLRDKYGLLPALNAYNTGRPYRHVRGFVLEIVKWSNRYRTEAGLWPLPCPKKQRLADRPRQPEA